MTRVDETAAKSTAMNASTILTGATYRAWVRQVRPTLLADQDLARGLAQFAGLAHHHDQQDHGTADTSLRASAEVALDQLADDGATTIAMIAPFLRSGQRVLEIGGGVGLAHAYLRAHETSLGLECHAVEPALAGHDSSYTLGQAILRRLGLDSSRWLPLAAADVGQSPAALDRGFDFIFSNNVIEHVVPLEPAVTALARVLARGGVMRHNCPNYAFPYEPHFGIPLLPLAPRRTEVLRPALRRSPLWVGLNFVTAREIARIARSSGLAIEFDRDHVVKTFARFGEEPLFRAKHPILYWVWRLLDQLGLMRLLGSLPPGIVTPMQFTLRRAGAR